MATGAVTLDFSKAQPLPQSGSGAQLDFSKAQPLNGPDPNNPGASVRDPRGDVRMQSGGAGGLFIRGGEQSAPGTTEGPGMTEGLAEWEKQGPGAVMAAPRDFAHGQIARGTHDVLAGAMNTAAPVAPFMAAAAPLATAVGIGTGTIGGKVLRKGAEAVGANPDQANVAEDVGNIAGGALGARGRAGGRPLMRGIGKIATVAGDTLGNDVTGAVSPRAYHVGKVLRGVGTFASRLGTEPPSPVFPGAPLPSGDIGTFPGASLPEAPPREVLQAQGLAKGAQPVMAPPASALGRIPLPPAVEATQPVASHAPTVIIAPPRAEYPPAAPVIIQRGPLPGSPEDILETRSIQEEVRDRAEGEDRSRLSAAKKEWFARNQPGSTKGELTGTADKPVRYTKTPGVKIAAPPSGTVVPQPDEDLTPLLKKSVKMARVKSGG